MVSKLVHDLVNQTPIKSLLTSNRFVVRSYFNLLYLWSHSYKEVRRDQRAKIERAFALLDGFRAKDALELGCGDGRWAEFSAGIADRLIATDISDLAIQRARAQTKLANVDFRQGDFASIPFPPQSFDFIFCCEVLYYLSLEQLDETVARISELLRPGGKVLLLHSRSLKDDESGMQLKEFGAKTIHDKFTASPLELEKDILEDDYRISLYRR
jgi:SAM-dependent methyltransferase